MKLKSIRCSICLMWHSIAHGHCPTCGAHHVLYRNGKREEFRFDGMRMVSGIPRKMSQIINLTK